MAAKKNVKSTDIKFSTMKKIAKEAKQTEQYTFEDGATLTFHPIFPQTQVDEMLQHISTVLSAEGDELQLSEEMMHKFILFHCIKKFTHLSKQLKSQELSGQLVEMEAVIDSGYFNKIIDEVFVPQEIHKVFDQMAKISGNFVFLQKMTEKMQDEVAKLEIKNKHIFENVNFGKEKQIPEV